MTPLRRWLGLPLLVAYSGLLILGAAVPEVRPALLDAPYDAARSLLAVLGIRSGHVLMHSTYPGDYRYQSYCIVVRGESDAQSPVFLFPDADGKCPDSGLRPRLPPVERALYRMLRHSWADFLRARGRQSTGAAAASERSRAMLSRIGAHFCGRPELDGRDDARIALVWYAWEVSYTTGHLRRINFLHYRYRCRDGRLGHPYWNAGDAEVLRFWGRPPWEEAPWE